MLDRRFPPPPDTIPSQAIRTAIAAHQDAEQELRNTERQLRELAAQDGAARIRDTEDTAAALAAGKPDPGARHQREHAACVEAAERTRDARRLLADRAWDALVETWNKNRAELDAAATKQELSARRKFDKALRELEQAHTALAEAAATRELIGDDVNRWRGPDAHLTVLPALPVYDGAGPGFARVADVFAALARLGLPPEPQITNPAQLLKPGQNVPLHMQGRSVAITPPGAPVERG